MHVKSPQSCLTLDSSPLGSSVHGILQARILEWVAMPSSRGCCWPRVWTHVSCMARRFFFALSYLGSPLLSVDGGKWEKVKFLQFTDLLTWIGQIHHLSWACTDYLMDFLLRGRGGERSSMSMWDVLCVNLIVLHRYKLFFNRPFIFSYC